MNMVFRWKWRRVGRGGFVCLVELKTGHTVSLDSLILPSVCLDRVRVQTTELPAINANMCVDAGTTNASNQRSD